MRKRPVLIVEDEPDIVDSLATIFSMEGFPVLCAKNGREALDIMLRAEAMPGMILLDLMMPVMDGHQFLRELQCHIEYKRFKDIPVVVLSATRNEVHGSIAGRIKKPPMIDELMLFAKKFATDHD